MVCPWVPAARHGRVALRGWSAQLCSQVGHRAWTSALERRTAGGQDSTFCRHLLSCLRWREDGTGPVPRAPKLGGRCVANTADVSCSALCRSLSGQRHWVSADHAEALHPKACSSTDTEGKEEGKKKKIKKIGTHSRVLREQLTERKAAFRSHKGETKQRGERPGRGRAEDNQLHSTAKVLAETVWAALKEEEHK